MAKGSAAKIPAEKAVGDTERPTADRQVNRLFSDLAQRTSREVGRAWVFALALGTIIVWALSGPFFGFCDTWQLVINTGTTVITFLMVFLIQNSQNRDASSERRRNRGNPLSVRKPSKGRIGADCCRKEREGRDNRI
jgi:hypothetical protein